MKIKITSDSTCDLSPELIEKYQIDVLPLAVLLGDKLYADGVDICPNDIFTYVAQSGVLPKTSATSVPDYADYFEKMLKENDEIIHFNISSKASVTHNNARTAAEDFGGRVHVIDSKALSSGQGLLVLKACDLLAEGLSAKEIVEKIEVIRDKVNTSFVPDVLDYLHKGGRCSLAAMLGAKMLKLHPLIAMEDGQLHAKKKYMGNMQRCIKNYVADLAEQYPRYEKTRCFITHSSAEPELVNFTMDLVKQTFDFDEVLETVAGSIVTSHCGKGTLGVLFITE